jgi:hypothetical protein
MLLREKESTTRHHTGRPLAAARKHIPIKDIPQMVQERPEKPPGRPGRNTCRSRGSGLVSCAVLLLPLVTSIANRGQASYA